ncbi:MAG TPA: hypothetical protein PKD98_29895 [Anaerolineae bacterium]|nr:hypothetical protein [Anaerolineae bacterium]
MGWAIALGTTGVLSGLVAVYLTAYLIRAKVKTLPPDKIERLHQIQNAMWFWGFLGGVCGVIAGTVLMRVTGVPSFEAFFWIALSTVGGICWGVVWGIVWAITVR